MKNLAIKKVCAGLLGTAIACSSMPLVAMTSTAESEDTGEVIFATGFEDGEGADRFSRRGETEVLEATTEYAHTGDYSLCVSGREKNWNGPQFRLDDGTCEANKEYYVNAWVMGQYYTTVTLSMQYTPEGATDPVYANLGSVSGNGWFEFSDMKISFTSDVTDVYVYFEGGNTDNIYVDDFSIEAVPVVPIQEDIASLSDVYSQYFKIGTAITPSNLSSPSFMNLVQKHFDDSLTAGNEMKPDALLDRAASIEAGETNPQVTLAKAKSFLNYARDNNIPVRGHTLVWHSQTPDWFFKEGYADDGEWVTKDVMLERMENYIKNVFAALEEEYPTVNIYAYDVVNEAWTDQGTPRTAGEQGQNGSSNSAWVQVFGDNSFIEPAFEYARKYAPEGCKLYYNDYNEYMTQKTTAIVEMATSLKEKGLIDGIGMQSHLDARSGSDAFPSINAYEKAVAAFAETGLDIQVTELDVTIPGSADTNLEVQAQYYSDILDICVKYADYISAVVFWGVTDDQSWRASQYPLIFDAGFQAKPAYYSIIDGIDYEIPEETTQPTTAPHNDIHISATGKVVAIEGSVITIEDANGEQQAYNFTIADISEVSVGDTISFSAYFHVVDDEYGLCRLESLTIDNTGNDTTNEPTTGPAAGIVYGDVNGTGEVEVADAIAVMSYVVNAEAFPLTAEQIERADVYQAGDGLAVTDAVSIQKYLTKLIDSLPES